MSGIAGMVRLDGSSVAPDVLERMAAATAHRGPDGQATWSSGVAAFAHAMLHTTAEARMEAQPFVDVEARLAIVADVRLDNRAELLSLLGRDPDTTGDAALILAAYRQWGQSCASRLEGDFAFAIHDQRNATIYCGRDPFGVKPLVYAWIAGKLFAFASEVRALLASGEIPRDVDEKRIADFLTFHFEDAERTFHRAVKRLPGGCTLTVGDGSMRIDRYWSPRAVPALHLRGRDRDVQYAAGYREHFTRAVHERMRAAHPSEVGAMLSGGLDSTSIACVARDALRERGAGPLPVFPWIFSDLLDADEREYQEAALAAGGLRAITLDSAAIEASPWTDLEALLPDGPPYAPNHYLNNIAGQYARRAGVRVLLDGTGGDSTISRGRARYLELFFRGRAVTLARELRALADRRGSRESLPRLFLGNVAAPLMPRPLLAFALRLRGREASDNPGHRLLTPRLAALAGTSRHRWFFSERSEHRWQLQSPMLTEGLELLDRTMAVSGAEGRYPFFDRRLAEYCLSLPADQKLADGYSRIVARRAMEGVLPPAIQWRAGKGKPGLHIIPALRAQRAMLDDLFVRDPSALAPYVDLTVLRRAYSDFISDRSTDFQAILRLWSAAVLAAWLRQS
jgi:asparagine synthase (glutamine-hydrolysing)